MSLAYRSSGAELGLSLSGLVALGALLYKILTSLPRRTLKMLYKATTLYVASVEIFFLSIIGVLFVASLLGIRGLVIPLSLNSIFVIPFIALLVIWEFKPEFIRKRIRVDEPVPGPGIA